LTDKFYLLRYIIAEFLRLRQMRHNALTACLVFVESRCVLLKQVLLQSKIPQEGPGVIIPDCIFTRLLEIVGKRENLRGWRD
jgi:hypothetical protein